MGAGHYRALEWDGKSQAYAPNGELGIQVDVEVCNHLLSGVLPLVNGIIFQEMHTGHSVTKSRGPNEGRFTFTSHDAGDHSICLSTNYTAGWFSNSHIRLYLDIVVGSTRPDVEHDRTHVGQVASKIHDLNQKLEDIRREQQYQREREAAYRDLSEGTNMRAVWYIIAEIVVLLVTCAWQLRHLRVRCHIFAAPILSNHD